MGWNTITALFAISLVGAGWALGRVVYHSQTYVRPAEVEAAYRKQATEKYEAEEIANCGYQLEWIQRRRGEKPVYRTPQFKREDAK